MAKKSNIGAICMILLLVIVIIVVVFCWNQSPNKHITGVIENDHNASTLNNNLPSSNIQENLDVQLSSTNNSDIALDCIVIPLDCSSSRLSRYRNWPAKRCDIIPLDAIKQSDNVVLP